MRHRDGLGLVDLFADLDQPVPGTEPGDEVRVRAFASRVAEEARRMLAQDHTVHGARTERLFRRLVEAFGLTSLSVAEDAGDVASRGAQVRPPDGRLVPPDGSTLLVEIRNHHPPDPMRGWSGRLVDHVEMLRYCDLAGGEPHYAIYWSRWRTWTLVPVEVARVAGNRLHVDFPTAIRANRLVDIGDFLVGTRPPLSAVLTADRSRPRSIGGSTGGVRRAEMAVGGVELLVDGQRLTGKVEKRIVWFLMMHGDRWDQYQEVEERGGELSALAFHHDSPDWDRSTGFAVISAMSSLYSSWYLDRAQRLGGTLDAAPSQPAGWLTELIPSGYHDKDYTLPLWLLRLVPSMP